MVTMRFKIQLTYVNIEVIIYYYLFKQLITNNFLKLNDRNISHIIKTDEVCN